MKVWPPEPAKRQARGPTDGLCVRGRATASRGVETIISGLAAAGRARPLTFADLHGPLPGSGLQPDFIEELCWKLVHRSAERESPFESRRSVVARQDVLAVLDALGGPAGFRAVQAALRGWAAAGKPLAFVRRLAERPVATGGLLDHEIARLLDATRKPDDSGKRRAFRVLVCAGQEPRSAWEALDHFCAQSGFLPNGQAIPGHLRVGWDHGGRGVVCAQADVPLAALRLLLMLRDIDFEAARELLGVLQRYGWRRARPRFERVLTDHRLFVRPHPADSGNDGEGFTTARAIVQRGIRRLVSDRPLHFCLLSRATIVETTDVKTMAVGLTTDRSLRLLYSPTFVETLSGDEVAGVLCHEANHVVLCHLSDPPDDVTRHRWVWTVACECTANEHTAPYTLPGAPITIDAFDLEPGQTTGERYELLKRRSPPAIDVACCTLHGAKDKPPATQDADVWTKVLLESLNRVGPELDAPTRGLLAACSVAEVREVARDLDVAGVAEVNWAALLSRLRARMCKSIPSRSRPNRRHPGLLGVVPGKRRATTRPWILCAIDTSASMSERAYRRILTELSSLLALADVVVVQCDTAVRRVAVLDRELLAGSIKGGGGTSLCPPFDFGALRAQHPEIIRSAEPDCVLYFTDGRGEAPSVKPTPAPVFWLL